MSRLLGIDIHLRGQPSLQNRLLISAMEDSDQLQFLAETFQVGSSWDEASPKTGTHLLGLIDFTNYQTPNQRLLLFVRLSMLDHVNYYIQHGATNFDQVADVAIQFRNMEAMKLLFEKVSTEFLLRILNASLD